MLETIRYGAFALAVMASSLAVAGGKNNDSLDANDLRAIRHYAERNGVFVSEPETVEECQDTDPFASYETYLPNEAKPPISKAESRLLIKYMENPSDSRTARIMAVYHLLHLPLANGNGHSGRSIERIKRAIYAQYFLLRAKQLGANERWIDGAIRSTERVLANMLPTDRPLDLLEGNEAHQVFLEAFNYTESNRYKAEARLLKDLLENPTNLLTNLYVAAVNLWNGGEAGYDDPTILYSYLKASYFGGRITELARRAEQEWVMDPANHELFRLAPTVGGFSLPSRRWLAKFHGDQAAVSLVNDELEQWFEKYPTFYMFPIGVVGFTEPENFYDGFQALLTALNVCSNTPDVFCVDNPRATYNVISFFLYIYDYFLKTGDAATAASFLPLKYAPQFRYDTWYLGHEAWQRREENIDQIAALYQNGDPSDDPINVYLKRHKWGPESSTCQLCHQVQGATWSEEEKNHVERMPEEALYVRDWPASRVSWDAHVIP